MGSSFATWKRCNKQRLMMSQSDLSKMQYYGLAPTIATRQLPRSGFVQPALQATTAVVARRSSA